jgi:hypothetical protein
VYELQLQVLSAFCSSLFPFPHVGDLVHPELVKLILADKFHEAIKLANRGCTSERAQLLYFQTHKVNIAICTLDVEMLKEVTKHEVLGSCGAFAHPLAHVLGLIADAPLDRPKPCEARTKQLQMLEILLNSPLKMLIDKPSMWCDFNGHGVTPLGLVSDDRLIGRGFHIHGRCAGCVARRFGGD